MFFALATVALAALSQIAHANPLRIEPIANAVKPTTTELTNIAANFPVHDIGTVAGRPNVTLGSGGRLHIDTTEAVFPALLLLCPGLNCGACNSFDLSTMPVDTCLFTSAFNSFAISQLSGAGLPFAVDVTNNANCLNLIQIPVVNQCFNVATGGPFTSFAVVE